MAIPRGSARRNRFYWRAASTDWHQVIEAELSGTSKDGRDASLTCLSRLPTNMPRAAVCHDILHIFVRVLGAIGLRRPRQQYPTGWERDSGLVVLFVTSSDHTFYSATHGSTANRPGLAQFRRVGGDSMGIAVSGSHVGHEVFRLSTIRA